MKGDVTVDGLLVLIINGVDCVVGLTVEVNKCFYNSLQGPREEIT